MPRREYHSSCVCVPPGGPPEGILDIAEYIVCRVVSSLCYQYQQKQSLIFRRILIFFGEKTHVAKVLLFVVFVEKKIQNSSLTLSAFFVKIMIRRKRQEEEEEKGISFTALLCSLFLYLFSLRGGK